MRRTHRAAALGHLARLLLASALLATAPFVWVPPVGHAAGSESAPASEPDDGYTMELWTGLMSPFCPGRLLIDCPSAQADALRERIAAEEAAGRDKDEVVAAIYADYGDIIWQAPRAEGFGLAAYLIPLFAAVVGIGVVLTFLRRQRRAIASSTGSRSDRDGAPPPTPLDADLERRIDAEMNELRS